MTSTREDPAKLPYLRLISLSRLDSNTEPASGKSVYCKLNRLCRGVPCVFFIVFYFIFFFLSQVFLSRSDVSYPKSQLSTPLELVSSVHCVGVLSAMWLLCKILPVQLAPLGLWGWFGVSRSLWFCETNPFFLLWKWFFFFWDFWVMIRTERHAAKGLSGNQNQTAGDTAVEDTALIHNMQSTLRAKRAPTIGFKQGQAIDACC